MLFNSYIFLFGFLPCVLAGWWFLPREAAPARVPDRRVVVLLRLVGLAVPAGADPAPPRSTTSPACWISRTDDERTPPGAARRVAATNVGILAYFKYAGFFVDTLNGIGSGLGLPPDIATLHIVLPIGISFYTFNSMSYTIDIFRRRIEPTRSILEYTTFVSLFPHLIAGPIVRFTDLAGQLRRLTPRLTSRYAALGVFFLSCGLVKKLLIADQLHPYVSRLYSNHAHLGVLTGWAAAVGYSLQLYFDFSGYSDMAVGLAWLLGFRFPQNFDSPFKAENISDFWRRWHMSLSSWFRDYLFIPLGGSRRGASRTVLNLS